VEAGREVDPSLERVPAARKDLKLFFAGTRGYIDARTQRHYMHSALEVRYRKSRIRIDCGEDWSGQVPSLSAKAMVITHAHPDHTGGLKKGAPFPVYATEPSWEGMKRFNIFDRRIVEPRKPFQIGDILLEAFPVEHSILAPAVGYRISAGKAAVFYCPDLIFIENRREALSGVRLYIGDGATLTRSFVRRRKDRLIGHAPVRTQLTWCAKEGVPRAVITHCGSEIVGGDEELITREIRKMAAERGIEAEIAYDGLEVVLR
jgi:phosphoribosyl 1,2-cyclic phosphodiesterase